MCEVNRYLAYISENWQLNAYYYIYHGLILMSWLLSIVLCMKGQRRYLPLCIVLTIQLAEELIVAWMYVRNMEFIWIYHVYALFDYTLFSLYFMQLVPVKYRRWVVASIILFTLASVSISYWYYHFESFPGANINTEGVFICIICTYVLLNLDIRRYDAIYKNPDFWICLGVIVFFAGTFFTDGLYTYLLKMDEVLAKKLFAMVNSPLNLIQYSCYIVGFLCAIPRRSSIQLS